MPKEGIMRFWALQLPATTVLIADTFFGSHSLAKYLPSLNQATLPHVVETQQNHFWCPNKSSAGEGEARK